MDYAAESALSDRRCNATLARIVGALGLPEADARYLSSMPRICTWFYLLSSWIGDAEVRRVLGHAICLHVLGIKLLDDIIDNDTTCSAAGLAVAGSLTCEEAYGEMAKVGASDDFFRYQPRAFLPLWRDQFDLDHIASASIDDWQLSAQMRTGRLLMLYSGFLSRQTSHKLGEADVQRVFSAVADVWTIFDDFHDLDRDRSAADARHINLALLIERGAVSMEQARGLLAKQQAMIHEMAVSCPPPLDFLPFFDSVVTRCEQYLDAIEPGRAV